MGQDVLAEVHLCSMWHQLGRRGWRTHCQGGFFTHLWYFDAPGLLPQCITPSRASSCGLDFSQHCGFVVDTWLWQLSPKRQEVDASRPAKGYAQTGTQPFPLYSIFQNGHGPTRSQRGGHPPCLDEIGQSHTAEECVE